MADLNINLNQSLVSTINSTATLLNAGASFTGTAEDVSIYDSAIVSVKTDQNGTYTIQFSNDGTNWDSVLTRYYRTNQIEAPHRFTISRRYIRVVFTNTSASNQTYLRLQTMYGNKTALNAPTDSVLAQDFDAVVTRPTDFRYEIALGRRQGAKTWNKFGYNSDVDTGSNEIIAPFGGTFTPLTTASTLSIVSTSVNDTSAGTGANSVVIYGIDANRLEQIEVVTLNGTTPVVTTSTWLGINRISIYLSGSNLSNIGAITATAVTGGAIQGQIPIGEGSTQQAIFFTQENHQFLTDFLSINVEKTGGGASPKCRVKGWVFSAVSNSKYLVYNSLIDTSSDGVKTTSPSQPFVIGEKSCLWFEATTDQADTFVSVRFSGVEFRDIDA